MILSSEPGTPTDVIVMADTAAIDALWARSGQRLEPGAEAMAGKLARAKAFIASGADMMVPCIAVDDTPDGVCVRFVQGRHRFAAMRDAGWVRVPLGMPTHTKNVLQNHVDMRQLVMKKVTP
jgi:hypothetical protein